MISDVKISVIIPTLNEEKNEFFLKSLKLFSIREDIEVIVSDGGSEDETLELAKSFGASIVYANTSSRAQRINLGVKAAKSSLIFLNHPRSIVDIKGIDYLCEKSNELTWGGFTHCFDKSHPLLSFTSWYSNRVRGKRGILYLDHCIFFKKEDFKDIPVVDIFEDTLLSEYFRKKLGKAQILSFRSTTSSIRFIKNGVFKQAIINQYLKLKYLLGADHKKMNKLYEKKTALNTDYKD